MFNFLKKIFAKKNSVGKEKNPVITTSNLTANPNNKKKKNKNSKKKKNNLQTPAISETKKVIAPPPELIEVPFEEGKKRFTDYNLHKNILLGLQYIKFMYCTPIQEMTLTPLLDGKDIAGKAQTGTGKTAAFLIATFNHILNNPPQTQKIGTPRALVLAPTRELAIQIHKDAEAISVFTGIKSVVLFGGMDHNKQRMNLEEEVDLVIGTPGRIIDYCRSGSLNLRHIEILIIDEADRMLDMGFIPDVKKIIAQTPQKENRQTMLFSATLTTNILNLASNWLVEPEMLESEPEKIVGENITQTFYTVSGSEKLAIVLYLINNYNYERMIIFGNRKDINLSLQRKLIKFGIKVELLSGDIMQEKRIKILENFRKGNIKILIATDVAARGIHVDNVSLVVNYDLPERPDDYVHRIGRTGRAGKQGEAISFLCEYGAYNLDGIEQLLGVKFPSILPPEEMLILPQITKKN